MHCTNEKRADAAQAPEVTVHAPGEGEAVWFLDTLFTVKASGRSGARLGLGEQQLPAGSETPLHRHPREDEAFWVLDGILALFLEGGRRVEAGPGTFVHIPRGVAHGFRAATPLRMLVFSDPAGFPEFVRACGAQAPRRALPPPAPPDLARVAEAARRHGIELLGPLPAGA